MNSVCIRATVPAEIVGMREHVKTSGLYRCWTGARRPHMAEWESQHQVGAVWDAAVAAIYANRFRNHFKAASLQVPQQAKYPVNIRE